MTAVRPSTRSHAATLRLAAVLAAAAALLRIVPWVLPVGPFPLDHAVVVVVAGLLAASAVVLARGAGAEGGVVGGIGRGALLAFAVLVLLRPVVRLTSPSGPAPTVAMSVWSTVSLVIAVLTVAAAIVAIVALARARAVPARVVVVAAVALAVHLVGGVILAVPGLVTSAPSQELVVALWTIAGYAEIAALLAVGLVWFLAGSASRERAVS